MSKVISILLVIGFGIAAGAVESCFPLALFGASLMAVAAILARWAEAHGYEE